MRVLFGHFLNRTPTFDLIDVWLGEDPRTNTIKRHMMFESTFDVLKFYSLLHTQ